LFEKTPDETQVALEKTIVELQHQMQNADADSEEYATMLNRLERLTKLKKPRFLDKISPDTMFIVGGNLVGIVIIVAYEHSHIITSKALSFAGKLR
jgi:hypothetical protein